MALEKAIYTDALLVRMAPERHILVDGKPCPLCGALEHPYAKYPPALVNSEQALQDQRIKIKRVTVEIAQLEQQLKEAGKTLATAKRQQKPIATGDIALAYAH